LCIHCTYIINKCNFCVFEQYILIVSANQWICYQTDSVDSQREHIVMVDN